MELSDQYKLIDAVSNVVKCSYLRCGFSFAGSHVIKPGTVKIPARISKTDGLASKKREPGRLSCVYSIQSALAKTYMQEVNHRRVSRAPYHAEIVREKLLQVADEVDAVSSLDVDAMT